jgi:molybdate transport repressor ModE-like protein
MDNIDWNDLRYLLAVARQGSAAAAARQLGVSHATVLRRLQSLEKNVGTPLFDRMSTGYLPTESGRRFVAVGEAFERTLAGTQREVEGQSAELSGTIRFTTTDSLAYYFMADILASFRARHPYISVEMRISNAHLNLEKREADVSLRPTDAPPPELAGRCVRPVAWGLYASQTYLTRRPDIPGMLHEWVVPEAPLAQGKIMGWLRARMGDGRAAASADSFLLLRQLAERGMGMALLPDIIAARSGLVLLDRPLPELTGGLWLLTHPHLRQQGRIRAFMDHVAQAMRA